ncbi:hypothetical protein ACWEFJ_09990 [Actinosynnema sp. NPDC004786]
MIVSTLRRSAMFVAGLVAAISLVGAGTAAADDITATGAVYGTTNCSAADGWYEYWKVSDNLGGYPAYDAQIEGLAVIAGYCDGYDDAVAQVTFKYRSGGTWATQNWVTIAKASGDHVVDRSYSTIRDLRIRVCDRINSNTVTNLNCTGVS